MQVRSPVRWDLVDKFEVLKKGSHSRARKFFSGEEDFFEEHFPANPIIPAPLFIEMIAQAGGVVFGLGINFKKEVILAKISRASFFKDVTPPCHLTIEARVDEEREEGAWISGSVKNESGLVVAEAELLLVSVDSLDDKKKIVFSEKFLKHFDVYNVARVSEELV